jgi:hypothetical protein
VDFGQKWPLSPHTASKTALFSRIREKSAIPCRALQNRQGQSWQILRRHYKIADFCQKVLHGRVKWYAPIENLLVSLRSEFTEFACSQLHTKQTISMAYTLALYIANLAEGKQAALRAWVKTVNQNTANGLERWRISDDIARSVVALADAQSYSSIKDELRAKGFKAVVGAFGNAQTVTNVPRLEQPINLNHLESFYKQVCDAIDAAKHAKEVTPKPALALNTQSLGAQPLVAKPLGELSDFSRFEAPAPMPMPAPAPVAKPIAPVRELASITAVQAPQQPAEVRQPAVVSITKSNISDTRAWADSLPSPKPAAAKPSGLSKLFGK